MSEHEHAHTVALIDRHFAGRIDPDGEQGMREALAECSACKSHYERQLLLARLDPHAIHAKVRLGRGLGLSPFRARTRLWGTIVATTAMAAAAVVVVLPRLTSTSTRSSEYGARGASEGAARLFVHRLKGKMPPERLGKTMAAGEELAFAYQNPAGFSHLLVFALDTAHRVYWYHPAWTDPGQRPSAVSIQAGAEVRELPEAIRHPLPAGALRIFGVFARRALTVADVEKAVADMAPAAVRVPLQGTLQVVETVEVKP